MSARETNEAVVRRDCQAWREGDLATVTDPYHDGCVYDDDQRAVDEIPS